MVRYIRYGVSGVCRASGDANKCLCHIPPDPTLEIPWTRPLPFGYQNHSDVVNQSVKAIVIEQIPFAPIRYQRVVVVSVLVCVVAGIPGVEVSVPLVSFSIMTPFRLAVRFVVDVTSSWYVGATPGFVTVVVLEEDDCAKPIPAINVRTVVAASKVFNIACSPWNI
jgi:hypothetical protein